MNEAYDFCELYLPLKSDLLKYILILDGTINGNSKRFVNFLAEFLEFALRKMNLRSVVTLGFELNETDINRLFLYIETTECSLGCLVYIYTVVTLKDCSVDEGLYNLIFNNNHIYQKCIECLEKKDLNHISTYFDNQLDKLQPK